MNSDMPPTPPGTSSPEGDSKTAPADVHPPAEIAPTVDAAARLEAELDAAKTEIGQWNDRFLRKSAELENFRKRAEKERSETAALAKSAVLLEILPVVDGFERALASLDATDNPEEGLARHREGVVLLYRQLLDALLHLGVVPMEAVGKMFDPYFHEALARVESADHRENTVVHELRKGYLFNDRLLRAAQVTVAVHPKAESRSES